MRSKRTVSIGKQQFPLQKVQKQIWIITRGEEVSRIESEINTAIVIKEIPFHKLETLYYQRLHEEISAADLCLMLKNL